MRKGRKIDESAINDGIDNGFHLMAVSHYEDGDFISFPRFLVKHPKHRLNIRHAIYLYLWFFSRITSIDGKRGILNDGKPIRYADLMTRPQLEITRKEYFRWKKRLVEYGYIEAKTVYDEHGAGSIITLDLSELGPENPTMADIGK